MYIPKEMLGINTQTGESNFDVEDDISDESADRELLDELDEIEAMVAQDKVSQNFKQLVQSNKPAKHSFLKSKIDKTVTSNNIKDMKSKVYDSVQLENAILDEADDEIDELMAELQAIRRK